MTIKEQQNKVTAHVIREIGQLIADGDLDETRYNWTMAILVTVLEQ